MLRTPLYESMMAAGARMGEYEGAETALVVRDETTEFEALRDGCGVYDLGWRAQIEVRGPDRTRWLNGMVTNNVRDLAVDHGNYSFLLNAQGRIQGDLDAYNRGEYLMLETGRPQVEKLKQTFDRYIIMDDVEIQDAGDRYALAGLQGPRSAEVLAQAGLELPRLEPMQLAAIAWRGVPVSVARTGRAASAGYELWAAPGQAPLVWSALVAAGATPVGAQALEAFRIACGIPKFGQDIGERDLPQETEQHHALNFAKGCYLGQEIVERIRSRGAVHRSFSGLVVEGPAPGRGAKIEFQGQPVGEVTSACHVLGRSLALGYLRREAARPGTEVQVGGVPAIVTRIPFPEAGPSTISVLARSGPEANGR